MGDEVSVWEAGYSHTLPLPLSFPHHAFKGYEVAWAGRSDCPIRLVLRSDALLHVIVTLMVP